LGTTKKERKRRIQVAKEQRTEKRKTEEKAEPQSRGRAEVKSDAMKGDEYAKKRGKRSFSNAQGRNARKEEREKAPLGYLPYPSGEKT